MIWVGMIRTVNAFKFKVEVRRESVLYFDPSVFPLVFIYRRTVGVVIAT